MDPTIIMPTMAEIITTGRLLAKPILKNLVAGRLIMIVLIGLLTPEEMITPLIKMIRVLMNLDIIILEVMVGLRVTIMRRAVSLIILRIRSRLMEYEDNDRV